MRKLSLLRIDRFLFVVIFLVGSSAVFGSPEKGRSHSLPKILIAKNGRTFVTENGKPFVPFGVNYYRPDTGWAPKLWKQFNAEATRNDFVRMKKLGVNCVRVFLTFQSFYTDPGVLRPEGLEKFDQFLAMAEAAGIYVHPTGPEHWEGPPNWKPVATGDEKTLQATEQFWTLFAARYRGRNVIFAYDLKNEPHVPWNNETIKRRWRAWLKARYRTTAALKSAWGTTNTLTLETAPIPPEDDALNTRRLLDFQSFREDIADEWTSKQVAAIKAADPNALTTVGCLQVSVPTRFWSGISDYTGYRPERQAKYLDFLEIHFYPSERGGYEYKSEEDELANLAYLEGIVREVAKPGKPVVLAEFGWYGGNEKPKFDKGVHPRATEEQHAAYCRHVIETSSGFLVGWLNWGLYDDPEARDCSEQTGLLTAQGKTKAWGKTFEQLSHRYSGKVIAPKQTGPRPPLDWEACITSSAAGQEFRKKYFQAFLADRTSIKARADK